jgi:hypothetical protein
VDEPFRLTANKTGFRVLWEGRYELNLDELNRPRMAVSAVAGAASLRIHPVADSADHFVDEWTQASWKEAAQWTAAAARSSARTWHARLRQRTGGAYLPQIESVHRCSPPGKWLVDLALERTDSKEVRHTLPEHLFFSVAERGSEFELLNVAPQRPLDCARQTARVK